MKLAYTPTSPYVRRVAVTVTELGLDGRVERIAVDNRDESGDYARLNPLLKVPVLVLDDGGVLIDSTAIAEYLDGLHDQPRLFPPAGAARVAMMQFQMMVNGVQEAGTRCVGEILRRPEHLRWPEFFDQQMGKIMRGLDWLEARGERLHDPVDYATICTAVLLGVLDFRLPDHGWRPGRPGLEAFYEEFLRRPSMTGSRHGLPADTS